MSVLDVLVRKLLQKIPSGTKHEHNKVDVMEKERFRKSGSEKEPKGIKGGEKKIPKS